ncbi:glycerol-3-phosphate dehydrogenase [Actinocatenispora thailandica]|uniref:Glycerol-3-phosphate dehydrogenase n=1 Tax=Actinocatenispora thailandica TaxID=227318 RepID=A0A7R7DLG2_9ACTN|nr:glycerol-3-phosphate dehydrogenase/oxidase [Actinocatenispora thailandica]BCJ33746.1 glycerol-3-phosphate dehydrogenase [Actinocatenispora thailandica]
MNDTSALSGQQRDRALADATGGSYDVVVIGAGATGAGTALDAAARGLSVVLVDAGDLAAGTSSRSGKTFHGGLRYLEQLNVKLVNQALHERDLMVNRLCGYLAQPEPFLYPLTRAYERPYIGAGVALYDAMTLSRSGIPHHRHYSRRGALRVAPALDPHRVRGGIQYYDVRVDDARHTMVLARTAASLGARVITRARVVEIPRAGDRVAGVVVEDTVTGDRHRITARAVVNAAGVWSAEIQRLAGAETFRVAPAKGVHVVLDPAALDSTTGIFARAEDSVIIIRKWFDRWMLGTTDTPYHGDLSTPRAEPAEIDYLLRNINRYLRRPIGREHIVGTFAGLRPLLAPAGDAGTTSALSRDHSVLPGPAGMITIVGGKYTTYRAMAADAVDAVGMALGERLPASETADLPLVGTTGWRTVSHRADRIAAAHGLAAADVVRLAGRYGSLTEQVLDADPDLVRPVPDTGGHLAAEFAYAVTHEGATTLEDLLWHRTHVSFETPDGGAAAAPHVAAIVAPLLGWDPAESDAQVKTYRTWLSAERAAL